ncbi:SUMF1/EgtB/PvdO family nonheme iron enzyme [uncultured Thiodictyon sp.]|uniref:SUMF1/EgtB/PvdO family nonheme iron enzyme n=1 Tax=uncultured Thiodictyon sp. TaxID=1846217 RepID=UPI003458EC52
MSGPRAPNRRSRHWTRSARTCSHAGAWEPEGPRFRAVPAVRDGPLGVTLGTRCRGVKGRKRVLRGGSWINHARNCRSANRNGNEPANRNDNIGLRLSRAPPQRGGEAQSRQPSPLGGSSGRGKQAGHRRASRARPERPPVARPLTALRA